MSKVVNDIDLFNNLLIHYLLVSNPLITIANSLDPDQARQNVRPDQYLNCLTLMVFLKEFLKKSILKKISRRQKKHERFPRGQCTLNLKHEGLDGGGGSGIHYSLKI